ncbi:MAG: hypothetical protein GY940_08725, partial [bacterium]|nr:hypothetical protein [bacterium]
LHHWTVTEDGSPPGFYVDVSRLPAGILTLEKNGQVLEYFYTDDELMDDKPVFIMGLGPFPVMETETAELRRFRVRINGRSVFWHYYIYSNLNGRRPASLKIVNRNQKLLPGIKFELKHNDENIKRALFLSQVPIPMSEAAYKSIELIEEGSEGLPLIPNLPNAAVSSLRFKQCRWVSEIFVYI